MSFTPAVDAPVRSLRADGTVSRTRTLPEETPVAMVFDGAALAVMMATPDDIADLAHGFALTEGIVTALDQIESFEIVSREIGVEARFRLVGDRAGALAARRRVMAGPVGCGLCGLESLEQANRAAPRVENDATRFSRVEIVDAMEALNRSQPLHDRTHAVHAAGFLRPGEGVVLVREDVGRHNALDKLLGALAREGAAAAGGGVVMTSRLSVELVQKIATAGCPAIFSASAPTARARRAAAAAEVTLAVLARDGGLDLHSHPRRIIDGAPDVA